MSTTSITMNSMKLATFRISPHSTTTTTTNSSSSTTIINGVVGSANLASLSNSTTTIKKEDIDFTTSTATISKIPSSNNNNYNSSTMESKLSSFGMARLFSRVEITLENSLLPEEKLSMPPSLQDGMDAQTEKDLRYAGSELIQKASILLKLPQVAAATGQILYQRFYCAKSFVRYDYQCTSMACVNLASKIEEAPRRIRDVMNVFDHLRKLTTNRESGRNSKIQPLVLDKEYSRVKNDVIKAERRVLKELGFCVHVKHPHKLIYAYLNALKALDETELIQRAWNYMNDSFRTDIFLRHMPETVACACIFLAARDLAIPLPEEPAWFEAFDVDRSAIEDICRILIELYRRRKPSLKQLEIRLAEARRRLAERQAQNRPAAELTPSQNAANNNDNRSPAPQSTQASRQGSPRADKHHADRNRDRDRRSPRYRSRDRKSTKNGSPSRRGGGGGGGDRRSRSPRSRSRSRSPRDRNLPKRYADDYRRHHNNNRPSSSSYESKGKAQQQRSGSSSSKKYESTSTSGKYGERRKR